MPPLPQIAVTQLRPESAATSDAPGINLNSTDQGLLRPRNTAPSVLASDRRRSSTPARNAEPLFAGWWGRGAAKGGRIRRVSLI